MSSYTAAPLKFPRSLRIIKSADYGVLVHTRNENTFRLTSKYFSINAMKFPEEPGRLRFGITESATPIAPWTVHWSREP